LLGPPRDSAPQAYSYEVNRALEAYAAGERERAEALGRDALRRDPDDAVAQVLLAGFLRESGESQQALNLLEQALDDTTDADALPEDLRALALRLRAEMLGGAAAAGDAAAEAAVGPVESALRGAERALAAGRTDNALATVEGLVDADSLSAAQRSRALVVRGRALFAQERHFAAVEALTQALALAPDRSYQARIYFRLGEVYYAMENWRQAEAAYTAARRFGLPSGLDVQAREALRDIARRSE
jgi:tetratricopeptide (TPR) repeat protein